MVEYNYYHTEWLQGERRVLFIVGLAGSGKTTLSEQYLGLVPTATLIHTDIFDREFRKGRETLSTEEYCNALVDTILETYEGQLIVEGVHCLAYNFDRMSEESIIIRGTSLGTSTFRALKRDLKEQGVMHSLVLMRDNMEYKSRLNKLKSYLVKKTMKSIKW